MSDPIQQTAIRIAGAPHTDLEHRLKQDMFAAIGRVKPQAIEGVSLEDEVLTGKFFEKLTPALQGVAVAKLENSIFFYDRIGWNEVFLTRTLEGVLTDFQISKILEKTKPNSLHDLAYISYKHVEKMMGKTESASYWEKLKSVPLDA